MGTGKSTLANFHAYRLAQFYSPSGDEVWPFSLKPEGTNREHDEGEEGNKSRPGLLIPGRTVPQEEPELIAVYTKEHIAAGNPPVFVDDELHMYCTSSDFQTPGKLGVRVAVRTQVKYLGAQVFGVTLNKDFGNREIPLYIDLRRLARIALNAHPAFCQHKDNVDSKLKRCPNLSTRNLLYFNGRQLPYSGFRVVVGNTGASSEGFSYPLHCEEHATPPKEEGTLENNYDLSLTPDDYRVFEVLQRRGIIPSGETIEDLFR